MQEKGPAAHPYYGARVKVVNEIINFNNDHDEEQEMSFAKISKMSIVSYVDENPQGDYWLYFWPVSGGGSLSVPSKAGGFANLLAALNNLPGFEREKLDNALQQLGKKHILIFKSENPPVNAAINPTGTTTAFEKIEEGLWLDDRQQLIPWSSFDDLDKLTYIEKNKCFPPNPQYYYYEYTLPQTTIFSGIQVSNLKVMTPSLYDRQKINPKWPVTRYVAGIILGHSGEEALAVLRQHITACWKKAPDKVEENCTTWRQERVTVRLNIYKQDEFDTYGNECTLLIDYEPDLTPFYTDGYQQSLQIANVENFQMFPYHFNVSEDYIRDPNVFYTPECFKGLFDEQLKSLIWIDEKTGKIGFANQRFSRIFSFGRESELLLEACYWRDELSGYNLYYKNAAKSPWYKMAAFGVENDNSEADFMDQLITLTEMPCGRQEDRQYY